MRIDNINKSTPTPKQNFGSLQGITYKQQDWVTKRLAIALEDSVEFRKFCSRYDVNVELGQKKVANEYEKPVINMFCQRVGFNLDKILGRTNKLTIEFSGDVPAPSSPLFFAQSKDMDSYTNTMCEAILKVMKLSATDFKTMLQRQKVTKKPEVIKLNPES